MARKKRSAVSTNSKDFREKVRKVKEKLIKDYKIIDLTENDELTLDKLASAIVLLEKIEELLVRVTKQLEENPTDRHLVLSLNDLSQAASNLRMDISRLQNDLNITRRQRDKDKEAEDVVSFIDKIRAAARKFSEYRTVLVFCDDCNNLVGQVWFKNAKMRGNKAIFVCDKCKKVVTYLPNMHSETSHPKNYNRVPQYL